MQPAGIDTWRLMRQLVDREKPLKPVTEALNRINGLNNEELERIEQTYNMASTLRSPDALHDAIAAVHILAYHGFGADEQEVAILHGATRESGTNFPIFCRYGASMANKVIAPCQNGQNDADFYARLVDTGTIPIALARIFLALSPMVYDVRPDNLTKPSLEATGGLFEATIDYCNSLPSPPVEEEANPDPDDPQLPVWAISRPPKTKRECTMALLRRCIFASYSLHERRTELRQPLTRSYIIWHIQKTIEARSGLELQLQLV